MLFGRGIVKTSERTALRGATSHQDLLDFLAIDFMESGLGHQAPFEKDCALCHLRASESPEFGLTWDGSRRLNFAVSWMQLADLAEFVRDHALSINGLLTQRLSGPGVHPYQPAELFWPQCDQFITCKVYAGFRC